MGRLLLPGRPGKVGISTNNGWNRGCLGGDGEELRAEKQTVFDSGNPTFKSDYQRSRRVSIGAFGWNAVGHLDVDK